MGINMHVLALLKPHLNAGTLLLLCFQILTTDPLLLSTLKIQVQIVGAIPTAVTNRAITTRWPTEFKIILSVLPPSRYR